MSVSRITIETVTSGALLNNPLGDPSVRPLAIYLPPGYDHSQQYYPVAYLLASFSNRGLSFLNQVAWEENIQQRLDRLIAQGKIHPMIAVMPDCFTRYGGSQYLDSIAIGCYQQYLIEIVDFIDRQFRSLPDRNHRAIVGRSSGGYGALMTALHYPQIFGLVADHSGDKCFEKCYALDLLDLPNLAARMDIASILENPYSFRPKDSSFFRFMNVVALSACYSPNPASPLGFDWPVDLHTGEIISDVWAKWKEKDPIELLDIHIESLQSFRLLYFDCGDRDEYYLHYGARKMARQLSRMGIAHIYEEYAGGHRHTQFRLDRSLIAISETFRNPNDM
jgi:enterochelin esterase-like enzyme